MAAHKNQSVSARFYEVLMIIFTVFLALNAIASSVLTAHHSTRSIVDAVVTTFLAASLCLACRVSLKSLGAMEEAQVTANGTSARLTTTIARIYAGLFMLATIAWDFSDFIAHRG